MFVILCILGIGTVLCPSVQSWGPITNMTVTHVWNNLEYWFDSYEDYLYANETGMYIADIFKRPYDADIHVNKRRNVRVFLSTPKIGPGIPYTLALVSEKKGKYGPKLLPYPDFKSHSPRDTPNCNRTISVFRIYVDPCKRLWAIDTGRDFSATPTRICPPKILVYDLATDELVLKYEIPEGQYISNSSTQNGIILDIYDPPPRGRCRKGKAYITDARGPSLLVYDLEEHTSWVIFNDLFKPNPSYIPTTIAGETFQFPDGLYTSTPYKSKNKIYLHAFASLNEIAAPLSVVNNKSLWLANPSGNQDVFQVIGSRQTQSPTQTKDSKGNIYFSILDPLSIQSWNPAKPFNVSNFKTVVQNNDTLQFVAGLKTRSNSKNEEILVALSNRLQKLNTGTISLSEENYRLMVCRISTLQSGRGKCGNL